MTARVMHVYHSIELVSIPAALALAAFQMEEQGGRRRERLVAVIGQRAFEITELVVLQRGFVLLESGDVLEVAAAFLAAEFLLLQGQCNSLRDYGSSSLVCCGDSSSDSISVGGALEVVAQPLLSAE